MNEETTVLAPRPSVPIDASGVLDLALSSRKPSTIRLYRKAYCGFAKWCLFHKSPSFPAADDVTALRGLLALSHGEANATALQYRGYLIERKLKANTINTYLAALRSFVSIARTCGVVPWDLEVHNIPTKVYRDTAGPGHENFKKMLATAMDRIGADGGTDSKGLRDFAMMRLLHDIGLRRFEMVALDLSDVDPEREWGKGSRGAVRILGKGRSDHEWQGLPGPTLKAVLVWVEARGREPGPLFVNMDPGRPERMAKGISCRLTANSAWRIVRRYGKLSGIERPVSPHRLRHAGGTRAAQLTNGNAVAVQKWGRWKNLSTAQLYIDNQTSLGAMTAEQVAQD
jgi:integrase/recombinase XerC